MSTAELEKNPALAPENDEDEEPLPSNNPEWYSRCCTDLSRLPGAATGRSRLDGMRAVLTRASWMWDNGQVLTCAFVSPRGNSIQRDKVMSVAKEWERYANIKLDFQPASANPWNATIRISFNPAGGSYSAVGKTAFDPWFTGKATLNLGWVYGTQTKATPEERGVILHEFGHAIGYMHEHQSPKRGDKLTLKEKESIEYLKRTQGWDEQKIRHNFLNVYTQYEVSNYSSVDLTSIMMYFMPAQLNEQGIEIPPNNELDALDKAFAFINYPFLGGVTSSDASVTLDNALNVIGVTGKARQSIADEFNQNDWQGVRAEFTRWALNAKAEVLKKEAIAEREAEAGVQTAS